MDATPLLGIVRKDLKLFISDRRALIMAFVVPIAIASFFGGIFKGAGSSEPARVKIVFVKQDASIVADRVVEAARADANLSVTVADAETAREQVRKGQVAVGVVIPGGFGEAAGRAFFSGQSKPQLDLWYDPSRSMELAMVRGLLTEHIMQAVSREVFTGATGRRLVDETLGQLDSSVMRDDQKTLLRDLLNSARKFYSSEDDSKAGDKDGTKNSSLAGGGITIPYEVREEAVTAGAQVPYNSYAHSFAGMGVQFLFFTAVDLGIGILLERQRGLWKRIRSAPIARSVLLLGKAASGTILALLTLLVSFAFAMIVFRVRIEGSVPGFLAVCVSCSLMAASFGLLLASLGRTPGATRGMSTLAVLLMVMLGGAWVPTFVFPSWLQRLTVVVPTRWAVDGLDAMTWRGIGLSGAVAPTLVLLGFAVLFTGVAIARFRWEEA